MRKEQENKDFLARYAADYWNNHNIDAFETYISDDFVVHNADGDKDREGYRELCKAYFAAFPDIHITTNDLISEGDKVTKVWTADLTHTGEFAGVPASGNAVRIHGIEVFRIEDGKIAEMWLSMDTLGMLQQIGAIPAPAKA